MSESFIEPLESRQLFSNSAALVIRGTNSSDVITAKVATGSGGIKVLRVTKNGQSGDISLVGIHRIEIDGLDGDDRIYIDKNTVRGILVNGGLGNDLITGGAGDDTLIGGRGNDSLYGENGNDYLKGYDGSDYLDGGDGDDTLEGGTGDNDRLFGGNGSNVLVSGNPDSMVSGGIDRG